MSRSAKNKENKVRVQSVSGVVGGKKIFKGWFSHDNHFEWKIFVANFGFSREIKWKSAILSQIFCFIAEYSKWMCAGGRSVQTFIE